MKEYLKSSSEVLQELSSDAQGLDKAEAQKRLDRNGKNKLVEGKKESMLHRFLKQLAEPMTIILIVAAIISAGVEIYNGVAQNHWEFPADVVIIMAVVLINAILGVFQESKAEKAIEALQEMSAATSKVMRDGKLSKDDFFRRSFPGYVFTSCIGNRFLLYCVSSAALTYVWTTFKPV